MDNIWALEAAAESGGGNNSWWIMIIIYAVIILGAYFLLFRPNSKKKKKEEANRKNAKIGDEITTIGGIVGRIVAVKDESDTIIIETGTDRQRLRLKRWAISSVETPLDRVQQAATESSENKPAEKKGLFGRKKYEKKQRNIGQHICQVFKIFSHRLYCRFVPMCGVIGHLCVCVCFGENNSYTGNSGSKYWYFGIKRYVCGIFVCKTMPQ